MTFLRNARIVSLQKKLEQARVEYHEALAEVAGGEVSDYVFANTKGPVTLSQLFGRHGDLFVIHSMGVDCPNCTMFADGFNGLHPHIADRAAFAVAMPDEPRRAEEFAASRGWRFPVVSFAETTFNTDMGFVRESGGIKPGVSAFQKDGARIRRVSARSFERQDEFCAAWYFLDLLPEGAAGWYPKLAYD